MVTPEENLRKIQKAPGSREGIGKGIVETTFDDALTATDNLIGLKTREMLGQLVNDANILNVVLEDQNLRKLQNSFTTEIGIIGENGKVLTRGIKAGIIPRDAIDEIKNNMQKGKRLDGSDNLMFKKLEVQKWNPKFQEDGIINRVRARIIFRQA